MNYISVCSGIEAASVAWAPLGWKAEYFSEIEKFPCRVLKYHYPDVHNLGDMKKWEDWNIEPGTIDLIAGGTPCQSFSVAGLRKGMDDARGNLAMVFCEIVAGVRPRWVVWENVPGVLSSGGGRDFGTVVGALAECGYGVAWRVLDAQFFGVPQRRRRVFVVGYLGDWRCAAAVLFERPGVCGDFKAGGEAGEDIAGTFGARASAGGGFGTDFECGGGLVPRISPAIKARDGKGVSSDGDGDGAPLIVHALKGEGFDGSEDGTGRGTPLVFEPRVARNGRGGPEEVCPPLKGESGRTGKGDGAPCVAIAVKHDKEPKVGVGICPTMQGADGGAGCLSVAAEMERVEEADLFREERCYRQFSVRRITPREAERLQGFPDDYTLVPGASDGARYRALGNSMAVPVMRWIGERICIVEEILQSSDKKGF